MPSICFETRVELQDRSKETRIWTISSVVDDARRPTCCGQLPLPVWDVLRALLGGCLVAVNVPVTGTNRRYCEPLNDSNAERQPVSAETTRSCSQQLSVYIDLSNTSGKDAQRQEKCGAP